MKVFIAVASSETQYTKSLRSVYELTRRDGDHIFIPETASYGSVTRTVLLEAFRKSGEYDAYLALDADQKHPRDLLEHLRARMEQGLDMVCAHYYRRQPSPIESLAYETCRPIEDVLRESKTLILRNGTKTKVPK